MLPVASSIIILSSLIAHEPHVTTTTTKKPVLTSSLLLPGGALSTLGASGFPVSAISLFATNSDDSQIRRHEDTSFVPPSSVATKKPAAISTAALVALIVCGCALTIFPLFLFSCRVYRSNDEEHDVEHRRDLPRTGITPFVEKLPVPPKHVVHPNVPHRQQTSSVVPKHHDISAPPRRPDPLVLPPVRSDTQHPRRDTIIIRDESGRVVTRWHPEKYAPPSDPQSDRDARRATVVARDKKGRSIIHWHPDRFVRPPVSPGGPRPRRQTIVVRDEKGRSVLRWQPDKFILPPRNHPPLPASPPLFTPPVSIPPLSTPPSSARPHYIKVSRDQEDIDTKFYIEVAPRGNWQPPRREDSLPIDPSQSNKTRYVQEAYHTVPHRDYPDGYVHRKWSQERRRARREAAHAPKRTV